MARRVAAWFRPVEINPFQRAQAVSFLREIAATEDGVIYDDDLDVPDHVLRIAVNQGWVSHGGGWGVGVAITDKGLAEVAAG